ncbi:MAG: hypothetical protein ACXIUP_03400, partial [Microcella sp.]
MTAAPPDPAPPTTGDSTGNRPPDPLLPRPVAVVWFLALLLFAAGLVVGGVLGGDAASTGTSILSLAAVLLGVVGQGLLYARRSYDALDRLQRVATT